MSHTFFVECQQVGAHEFGIAPRLCRQARARLRHKLRCTQAERRFHVSSMPLKLDESPRNLGAHPSCTASIGNVGFEVRRRRSKSAASFALSCSARFTSPASVCPHRCLRGQRRRQLLLAADNVYAYSLTHNHASARSLVTLPRRSSTQFRYRYSPRAAGTHPP